MREKTKVLSDIYVYKTITYYSLCKLSINLVDLFRVNNDLVGQRIPNKSKLGVELVFVIGKSDSEEYL